MFENLQALPPDPILALTPAFRADPNPRKIDLGAGVYKDEQGDTPVMRAVKQAESDLLAGQRSKAYVGPAGAGGYKATKSKSNDHKTNPKKKTNKGQTNLS